MSESGWWRDDRQPGYRKPRRRPRQLEQREQRFLFDWLRVTMWHGRPLEDYAYHVPNGGWRSRAEAAILKGLGVKPGVPDVVLAIPAGGFHGAYCELKRPDGKGRLSEEQIDVQALLRAQGYVVINASTWHGAAAAFCAYLQLPLQAWPARPPQAQAAMPLRRKRRAAA